MGTPVLHGEEGGEETGLSDVVSVPFLDGEEGDKGDGAGPSAESAHGVNSSAVCKEVAWCFPPAAILRGLSRLPHFCCH